ncbi:hypothetical protein ACS0TY_021636 [Phlomoides rotata]
MGSHQKITEYERRRLENIKHNSEMLAALKIKSKVVDLAAVSAKRERSSSSTYFLYFLLLAYLFIVRYHFEFLFLGKKLMYCEVIG